MLGQPRLQIEQPRAGAHGHHQFAGLVGLDARQRAGIQQFAMQKLTIKVLGAAPPDAQGAPLLGRLAQLVGHGFECVLHGAQW